MTDRTSGQHRTTAQMGDALRWTNISGESVPAYGVIQLRTNYSTGYSQASKPDDTVGLFFANGAVAVASTKKGESLLWNRPRLVKVEGSPSVGTEVGPVAGSWAMSEDGTGFFVIHQPVGGVATVVQVGGGGGSVRVGTVSSVDGCGWYTVELGSFGGVAGSGTSGSVSCDPCADVVGSGTSACELNISAPPSQVVGDGQIVTAYDTFSDKILLQVGTDCVLAKVPGAAAGSGSGSGSGTTEVWQILNGYREHIVQYRERGQCCPTTGVWLTTHKTPIILLGHECAELLCAVCPDGSGSA